MLGTPAVAIEHEHKVRGIMRDLSLRLRCFPSPILMATCWWTKYANLFRTVTALWHRSDLGLAGCTKMLYGFLMQHGDRCSATHVG